MSSCNWAGALELVPGSGNDGGQGLAGFWEVLNQQPKTEFSVRHWPAGQILPNTLAHGYSVTCTTYLMNHLVLVRQLHHVLRELLTRRARDGVFATTTTQLHQPVLPQQPQRPQQPQQAPAKPSTTQLLAYAAAVAQRSLTVKLKTWLGASLDWQVHYKHQDWPTLTLAGATAVPNRPGGFFADPFLHQTPQGLFCILEEFCGQRQRGIISALRLEPEGPVYLGPVLEEPFHLSFPYLFEFDGTLYMCPEMREAGEIRLYACKSFPMQWELHSVAIHDVAALDTLIFQHGKQWCLLTGILPGGDINLCPELHLFTAEDPLSGRWVPHAANPIVVDPEFARNGGLLHQAGKRFRVSQACVFGIYGASISVSEIQSVSADGYTEAVAQRFNARSKPGNLGLHHMCSVGGMTVWDERAWHWPRPWRWVLSGLQTLQRALRKKPAELT
jgi:hypothetical protein